MTPDYANVQRESLLSPQSRVYLLGFRRIKINNDVGSSAHFKKAWLFFYHRH
jgi:hypothetical protein